MITVMKNSKTEKGSRECLRSTFSEKVIKEALIEKVTFEEGPKYSNFASHGKILRKTEGKIRENGCKGEHRCPERCELGEERLETRPERDPEPGARKEGLIQSDKDLLSILSS